MRISDLDPDHLTIKQMTQLLFDPISDDGQSGDCIFVFGSNKSLLFRVPKAVELFLNGRSGRLLFSGGVIWDGQADTEAELMKEKAIRLGVPVDRILIETESMHTKENVLASLLILDRAFMLHHVKRLLVVTSRYHMRRAHLTLKTYMPNWIQYTLCPVDDQTTKKHNWWLHKAGAERVQTESRKLIEYVRMGYIEDDVL